MSLSIETLRAVERRAGSRCEYCKMHQLLQGATFHVEHIMPRSRGGLSVLENLAWCCPSCNLHKSDRVDGIDRESGATVTLFDPRGHDWNEHFEWNGYELRGQTPIGGTTVVLLNMNHPRRIQIRRAEQLFQLFPP
jgi:hypothetical protein